MRNNNIVMFYNYFEDYQYDSCVYNGICSIGPRTSSLQEVLIMYLKLLAFYTIELQNLGGYNKDAKQIILDTISMLMQNLEYQNKQFEQLLINIKTLLIDSKKTYLKICKERNTEPKFIKTNIKLDSRINNINTLIKQGENEYAKRIEYLSPERKCLLEIIGLIINSLCVNVVELDSYNENKELSKKGFNKILTLLNFLNYQDTDFNDIIEEINQSTTIDNEINKEITKVKTKLYGEPQKKEVSQSTRPNKAILVAGSSLKELENILEYTKDKNIDIYTHGEMIQAHTYPKFTNNYPQLQGQFGMGIENCLLDFATFPGAIFITKFATESIEYLYRGRLFTTDYFVPKGAIKIEQDYSPIIKSALDAKGFKRGKSRSSINVGVSLENIKFKLQKLFKNLSQYSHIIIIGPESFNKKNKLYFEKLIKNIPDNIFIINFGTNLEKENIVSLDGITDFSKVYYIIDNIKDNIKNNPIDISIFISKCDRHTISNIIYLKNNGVKNIFLSQCSPILLNPSLINVLTEYYDIIPTTDANDDIKQITNS